ncbi:MAG: hypothetical protein ABIN80_26855 [Dyadobacter sp.]|uniref:hypothetical protein n=1 Tax=Dyadobacter sp. TaxID=1914288 RepID=UPI003263D11E
MKNIVLFISISLLLTFGCKRKDKNTPDPIPEEIKITELTDPDFIQYIEVPGSEKIVFDSTLHAYLITLPASFTTDRINIKFKFYPGAFLTTGHSGESAEVVDFTFRSRAPLYFQISSAKEKLADYQIYVKHNGPLKGSISDQEDFQCDPDGNFSVPLEITSGLGTNPSSPDSKLELQAILKDEKTGMQILGTPFQAALYFNNVQPFVKSENLSVSLKYGDQVLTVAQNKKLTQLKVVVYQIGSFPLFTPLSAGQKVEIFGKGFTANKKYTLKIQNDFLDKPFVSNADFTEINKLSGTIPENLPIGSYSVGIFQNDTLVNGVIHTISKNEKEQAIGQIWTGVNDYPTSSQSFYVAKKISVQRGKSLFVNPFPAIWRMYEGFDPKKVLPDLQLKNAAQTATIKAAVKSDGSYGDASIRVYYGEYTAPISLAPGMYEARLVYADKSVSLPFWSKIEIK